MTAATGGRLVLAGGFVLKPAALLRCIESGEELSMTQRDVDLGDAELEVLNVLWKAGPCTVRSVLNELHGRGRELAYTTVLTFLSRLEQKGFVDSDKSGLAYVYKPTVTRRRVTRSRLRTLLQQLYDGEAGPLVLELVRHEKLKREDLDELHALIDRLDKKTQ